MKKNLYMVNSPKIESDLNKLDTSNGLWKHYGYEIPGFPPCPACGTLAQSSRQYHHRHELPFPCPPEIVEESEHLIATIPWTNDDWPEFDQDTLLPYLQKWTDILRNMGYKLEHTIRPDSNFAPFFFYPFEEEFAGGDFIKASLPGKNGWFVSDRLPVPKPSSTAPCTPVTSSTPTPACTKSVTVFMMPTCPPSSTATPSGIIAVT